MRWVLSGSTACQLGVGGALGMAALQRPSVTRDQNYQCLAANGQRCQYENGTKKRMSKSFSLIFQDNDIDNNGLLLQYLPLGQLSVQAKRYLLTNYHSVRKQVYIYIALALLPTGFMGIHRFYINDFRQGYIRMIMLFVASLFYGFAFQQLIGGKSDSFESLMTIGSIISIVNAIMILNDVYNAISEIKKVNSRIAGSLVALIIATDH